MANEVSIYEPRTMGRVVQKLPPVRTFFRSTFFKHEETFTTKNVDVDFRKGLYAAFSSPGKGHNG